MKLVSGTKSWTQNDPAFIPSYTLHLEKALSLYLQNTKNEKKKKKRRKKRKKNIKKNIKKRMKRKEK